MKKIDKALLPRLWEEIGREHALFLPLEKGGKTVFAAWHPGGAAKLERVKTDASPKHLFFTPNETYLHFKTEGKKLRLEEPAREEKPFVLFGVRPCDAAAFQLLDRVFLSEPADRLYAERRERGIVVSLACSEPAESCFCGAFGIDAAAAPPGADVAVWDLGGELLWHPVSGKGEALTQRLEALLKEAGPAAEEPLAALQNRIRETLAALPLAGLKPSGAETSLKEQFDSPVWDELGRRCLGCGVCTFACPTCHCYDIQDFDGGAAGERFRCWDSCMFSDFTQMAHGNPRTSQKERFRQRFMHKLVYYPNNYGPYACTGCGRCLEQCPASLHIVRVIRMLGGENS